MRMSPSRRPPPRWAQRLLQRAENPRLSRRLTAELLLVLGLGFAIAGVGATVRAAMRTGDDVRVMVTTRDVDALQVPVTAASGQEETAALHQRATGRADDDRITLRVPGAAGDVSVEVPTRRVRLRAANSTLAEQLLSQAHLLAFGICAAIAGFLLRQLLRSIAAGDPFTPANVTRLSGLAGLLFLGGGAVTYLPVLAAARVLDRVGLDQTASPLTTIEDQRAGALAVLVLFVFGAIARAFQQGTALARDAEGLV
jgi:hypothetical protein